MNNSPVGGELSLPLKNDTHEIFEQVAMVLSAQGLVVNEQVVALVAPLVLGDQDFGQHRETLEAMISMLES